MTLVSVIGDFHSSVLPIFYHFKDEIKNHIVVYDDFKHDILQAKKILKGTEQFIQTKKLKIKTYQRQIDEDSEKAILSLVQYILSFSKDNKKIFINITDGLANITFGLIRELINKDITFISYDRFDNTYTILGKTAISNPISVKSLPIEEHLQLKNILIESMQSTQSALEYEDEIATLFEELKGVRGNSSSDFIKNTQTGFLYELYIYNIIKHLNFDDIKIGVKVKDFYSEDFFIENEFDILIMKENHLHMIECKFREDFSFKEINNFIYKLDSVKSTLDDDASIIFISDSDIYDAKLDTETLTANSPYKRASARRIFLRGSPVGKLARFLKDVDSIFSLQTPNLDSLVQKIGLKG